MAEISDEELETLKNDARHEGRAEREREWQELENMRRLTDLENRLDSLTSEVVTSADPEPAVVTAADPEPAVVQGAEAPEVGHVQAPPEPHASHHHEKHKPKFRIL